MLSSFVISLKIDRDLALPGLGGETLHGLFFEVLRGHDAGFAEHLHRQVDKPFSLSGVLTAHPTCEGRLQIRADSPVEFRLRLLDDEIIERTLVAFGALAMSGAPVRFAPALAEVLALIRVSAYELRTALINFARYVVEAVEFVKACIDDGRIQLGGDSTVGRGSVIVRMSA